MAAEAREQLRLGPGLYPFGDGPEADLLRQPEARPHGREIAGIAQDVVDELVGDLEPAEAKGGEIAEGGGAGAEIVDGHTDPEAPQLLDRILGFPRGIGQNVLGELELDLPG